MTNKTPHIQRSADSWPALLPLPVLSLCCLLLLLPGCGESVETTAVTGKVTYRGKPLDHGAVSFLPGTGKPITAGISPEGTYEAQLPAGEYQVSVLSSPQLPEGYKEGDPLPPEDPNALPGRFSNPRTSQLTASVPQQDEPLTVDLEMK